MRQYKHCLMMTPDFPLWSQRFDAQYQRLRQGTGQTLHQLQTIFGSWIAPFLLSPEEEGPHSRQRLWPLRLVFWTFLWQVAQAGTACREAIRQAQCLCRLRGQSVPPDEDSPYCQARGKLPLDRLEQIQRAVIAGAEKAIAPRTSGALCGSKWSMPPLSPWRIRPKTSRLIRSPAAKNPAAVSPSCA